MKHLDLVSPSRSPRARRLASKHHLLVASLLCDTASLGCGPKASPESTHTTTESTGLTATTTATASTSGSLTTSTSSSSTTDPIPTTTENPTCPSLMCTDDGASGENCDVFAQNCPDGQKCAPVILEPGSGYEWSRCVPVTGTDEPGDPCTSSGANDGLDSCIKGAMCWYDPGTCIAHCTGTPDAPICPNDGACTLPQDAYLSLCIPDCDPLLQDCNWEQVCYAFSEGFACAPDASGDMGEANAPCEFINVCDEGLLCADPAFVGAGCPPDSLGCCTPFCAFPNGPCPNPDQQCIQWFDPATLPEGDSKLAIGSCGVPQ